MGKADIGAGISGAASGGIQGFAAGGPVGAGIGAVAGGLGGLFGGGKKKKKKSRYDKEQKKLYAQEHDALQGKGPLADLYNYNPEQANAVFDKNVAAKAHRSFKEDIIPKITGQFRSQNLQNSSYHGEGLARAGRDVQESLDAKRAEMNYNAEEAAKGNKRSAIQNIQSRNTFDYDQSQKGNGGFNMSSILNSVQGGDSGKILDQIIKYAPGGV